jgi:hypothetical protein
MYRPACAAWVNLQQLMYCCPPCFTIQRHQAECAYPSTLAVTQTESQCMVLAWMVCFSIAVSH